MLFIDLAAIKKNVAMLKAAAPSSQFMAVVKDNAYGHGLVPVSQAAVDAGADWLGVVHLREAAALRAAGIEVPILMLGYVAPDEVSIALQHRIDVPVMSLEHARALASYIQTRNPLRVHLKVETGMHRFGVADAELQALSDYVSAGPFEPIGIYSHLAAVEDELMDFTHQQIEDFDRQSRPIGTGLIRHLAASAATLIAPESHFDLVRCGLAIYGLWPSDDVRRQVEATGRLLQPALSWTEPIRAIKQVDVGQPVGYGCTWKPDRPSRVALLDVGYADGLPRSLSNQGVVMVGGQSCPIVGRICSNVTFVDVTDASARVGDGVLLIEADAQSASSLDKQAERAGTINYELAIRLPDNLERHYHT